MSKPTKIQWTERTWNPIGGCCKISPGCKFCYAIGEARRLGGNKNRKIQARYSGLTVIEGNRPNWSCKTFIDEEVLRQPLANRTPTTYFISLSDLFYDQRPDEDIDRVFAVMALASWHKFLILTKYHERMASYVNAAQYSRMCSIAQGIYAPNSPRTASFPLPNVALGVSVEDHQRAGERIHVLLQTPAAMRFVSAEPLLEAVTLDSDEADGVHALGCGGECDCAPKLDWVIVGGESGHGARPCDIDHVRSVVKQCREARVPVFVKQLGARPGYQRSDGWRDMPLKDPKGGEPEEWPADLRVREYPAWLGRPEQGERDRRMAGPQATQRNPAC